MDVRTYQPADREACLAVFDSNAPEFFAPGDRPEFEKSLENPGFRFFVLDHDGAVLGCGGYSVAPEQASARLVWGMVRRDAQRQGLGRLLLMYRLREITRAGGVQIVALDAPQHAAAFFQGQGFKAMRPNTTAGGVLVPMAMKLNVCP